MKPSNQLRVNMMALRASGYLHPELAQELTNNVAMVLILDEEDGCDVDPVAIASESIQHRIANAGTYGWEAVGFDSADVRELAEDMADAWTQWTKERAA